MLDGWSSSSLSSPILWVLFTTVLLISGHGWWIGGQTDNPFLSLYSFIFHLLLPIHWAWLLWGVLHWRHQPQCLHQGHRDAGWGPVQASTVHPRCTHGGNVWCTTSPGGIPCPSPEVYRAQDHSTNRHLACPGWVCHGTGVRQSVSWSPLPVSDPRGGRTGTAITHVPPDADSTLAQAMAQVAQTMWSCYCLFWHGKCTVGELTS